MAADKAKEVIATDINLTTSASMMSDSETEPFRFFDLPLELRNWVYSCFTKDIAPPADEEEPEQYVTATAIYIPELRLVSQQFKQEYDQEVFRAAQIRLVYVTDAEEPVRARALISSSLPGETLGLIQHVVLRLEVYEDENNKEFGKAVHIAQDQIPKLASSLPALRTLRLELWALLEDIEDLVLMPNGDASLAYFFGMQLLPKGPTNADGSAKINIDKVLLLNNELFTVNPDLSFRELARYFPQPGNNITYRATPASNLAHSWYGLDLETVSAGQCILPRLLADQDDADEDDDDDDNGDDDEDGDEDDYEWLTDEEMYDSDTEGVSDDAPEYDDALEQLAVAAMATASETQRHQDKLAKIIKKMEDDHGGAAEVRQTVFGKVYDHLIKAKDALHGVQQAATKERPPAGEGEASSEPAEEGVDDGGEGRPSSLRKEDKGDDSSKEDE